MPPRWLVRGLERVAPAELVDDVVGDLEELDRRRVRRWGGSLAWCLTVVDGLLLMVRYGLRRVVRGRPGAPRFSATEWRLAVRLVRKQPVLTLTAVVALGVGIGIAAGAFSVFRQALYGKLPFANGDRFVVIETSSDETREAVPLDLDRLAVFRRSVPALRYLGGAEATALNLVYRDGEVERVGAARVTPGTFGFLPYVPIVGRLLQPSDARPGVAPVALIRESLWARRFGRALDVVGQPINVAGERRTIVGVLPDSSGYPAGGELWLPLDEATLGARVDEPGVRGRVVGILADGATVAEAQEQVAAGSRQVTEVGQGARPVRQSVRLLTRPAAAPDLQMAVLASLAIVLMVLLVIAANVANLIVARTSRRAGELAVRSALGATRGRLVRQLVVEVLVINGLATVLGLAAAAAVLRVYDRVLDDLPFWIHLRLDLPTVMISVVMALLASVVTGVLPARRATGGQAGAALRAAGRGGGGLGVGRIGGLMIAVEVALSVALLGTAVVFAQGFRAYVRPAFQLPERQVLTAELYLTAKDSVASDRSDSVVATITGLRAAMLRIPGVIDAAVASRLPREAPIPEPVQVEGDPATFRAPVVRVGSGFFAVLGVTLRSGRGIDDRDLEPGALPVAVVNESFALTHFGTLQVVGRRVRLAPPDDRTAPPWREIVGVAPDLIEVVGSAGGAGVYLPFTDGGFASLALRTSGDPERLAGPLRRAVFDLDPALTLRRVVGLHGVGKENRSALLVMSSAMVGIAVIALLVSLAGIYSIVSLAVTQRTREIGVRVALGASRPSIVWSVVRRSGYLVLAGTLVGAGLGAMLATRRMFVFSLPAVAPWVFPGVVALVFAAGVAACWVPVRRALALEPLEALRQEH